MCAVAYVWGSHNFWGLVFHHIGPRNQVQSVNFVQQAPYPVVLKFILFIWVVCLPVCVSAVYTVSVEAGRGREIPLELALPPCIRCWELNTSSLEKKPAP